MRPWLGEHPEADFAELETVFGTPEVIAAACLGEMGTGEILARMSIRKKVFAAVTLAVVIGIVLFAGAATVIVLDNHKHTAGKTIVYSAEQEAMEVDFP